MSAMGKIRVAIAEDQAMVLGALAALLETEPDIAVCARAQRTAAPRSRRSVRTAPRCS